MNLNYRCYKIGRNIFNWIQSSQLVFPSTAEMHRYGASIISTVCVEYKFRHKKDCIVILGWSHKLKETKIMMDYMVKRKNQFELSMYLMRPNFHQRSVIIVNKVDKRDREKNTQWFNTVISKKKKMKNHF